MMIRTQISLSEDQMLRARAEAERQGTSLAAVIREALDRMLNHDNQSTVRRRAREAVGGFRSDTSDTSEHHDQVLAGEPRW